jgi:hypothetical protein
MHYFCRHNFSSNEKHANFERNLQIEMANLLRVNMKKKYSEIEVTDAVISLCQRFIKPQTDAEEEDGLDVKHGTTSSSSSSSSSASSSSSLPSSSSSFPSHGKPKIHRALELRAGHFMVSRELIDADSEQSAWYRICKSVLCHSKAEKQTVIFGARDPKNHGVCTTMTIEPNEDMVIHLDDQKKDSFKHLKNQYPILEYHCESDSDDERSGDESEDPSESLDDVVLKRHLNSLDMVPMPQWCVTTQTKLVQTLVERTKDIDPDHKMYEYTEGTHSRRVR